MAHDKPPATAAIRVLRVHKVPYTDHLYTYEERGGTAVASRALGVEEHAVVKTIVMEDDQGRPMIVLMHGDRQISTKGLARHCGVKSISPCHPGVARRHTGYVVGGTSPFGTRTPMPVYIERTILDLDTIYVNAGRRGYLVGISPSDLVRVLRPEPVEVAI
jgi:Cys-tRNA(Pro) deacylase